MGDFSGKLLNKIAVITGGSSGIGLATAKLFYKEGAQVVLIARGYDALQKAKAEIGGEVITLAADVAKPAETARALAEVQKKFGRIDILFANAGISECPPIKDTTEKFFDQMMSVNVKGVFFPFIQALPFLSEKASVIFTSSVAHERGRPGDPLYSASKAAVRSLARTLAADEEVLSKKIRINVVSPGAIQTPLTEQETEEMQKQIDDYISNAVPMQRWGQAMEVARAVLFLASDDSSYTTGAEIAVDGGLAQI